VEAVGSQVERGQRLLFHDFSANPRVARNNAIIMLLLHN
jgi:hypothetical protein